MLWNIGNLSEVNETMWTIKKQFCNFPNECLTLSISNNNISI